MQPRVDLNAHLTRQLNLIPMEVLDQKVDIIGVGAIGSFVALNLVKMGMKNITVWDNDEVSVENMSCQFFRHKDIGVNKAVALLGLIHDFTGVEVKVRPHAYLDQHAPELSGIIVSAVDCMNVRRKIFENAGPNVRKIIDPRMSAEFFALYCIDPFAAPDADMYRKTLYANEEAVQERCTAKSTIYTATLAAGLVVKTVKDLLMDKPYPRTIQWDISATKNPMMMYPGGASV